MCACVRSIKQGWRGGKERERGGWRRSVGEDRDRVQGFAGGITGSEQCQDLKAQRQYGLAVFVPRNGCQDAFNPACHDLYVYLYIYARMHARMPACGDACHAYGIHVCMTASMTACMRGHARMHARGKARET